MMRLLAPTAEEQHAISMVVSLRKYFGFIKCIKVNIKMNFKDYQKKAATTAVFPHPEYSYKSIPLSPTATETQDACAIVPIMYCALGLAGESGDVAENVKKSWRNKMRITEDRREKIKDELGDVCWYVAQLATELDLDMDEIASNNIKKLSARKSAGELKHE